MTPGGNEEARKKAEKEKTTDADVIQFSGCRDDQTSADTKVDGKPTGAASYALLHCLHEKPKQTYTEVGITDGVVSGGRGSDFRREESRHRLHNPLPANI